MMRQHSATGARLLNRAVFGLAIVVALLAAVLLAVAPVDADAAEPAAPGGGGGPAGTTAVATFAAGCFWCVESDFDKVAGVISTTSGYTGGRTEHPDYRSVSTGNTGHVEALQVTYDPRKVSYETLLATFWHNVDPVDGRGQFCDRGPQYAPAIFTHSPEQRRLAEASLKAMQSSGRFDAPIVVPIRDATAFTAAEPEHQDYYKRNPVRYKVYRYGCGRDQRLQQIWGSKASG